MVFAPNKDYAGVSAGVVFVNGAGSTDDPHLLEWFRIHGYEVEESLSQEEKPDAAKRKRGNRATTPKGA